MKTLSYARLVAAALPLALLGACASTGSAGEDGAEATPSASASREATEAQSRTARIAVTYDGGIKVLDALSLEEVGDIPLDGFNRLNPAGDEQHLMVSTTGGFQVLDLGTWAAAHGDHAHYWTADPVLTDTVYPATEPGHVVVHEGRTALFDDGTGTVSVIDTEHVSHGEVAREEVLPAPHHGVAVELSDDTLVVSEGTEEERSGIRILDADGEEIAASDDCPGVHGEAMAADEAVLIGCEDGAILVHDGEITKVDAPDSYGRIGNQAGSEESPVVLGDYKVDPDAELERPERVSLIDTRTGELTLVDLPSSYTFRSLARGDDGEALVLGTDGSVHVIDPEKGELVDSIEVIDPWEEPLEWQEPRPAILTLDGSVYVTDPANDSIHAVDVETGEVWNSAELGVTPNEIEGVLGEAPEHDAHEGHDHEDEGHDDHEHEEG
ncbi:zinc metallochaperone AztD [Myceligenerans pegani]|uniref:PQQ-like beta-propeller repeat protein n=1 Tax=Myceligenerans pegani TaxID=2776917 RepID=A0ABR9N3N2_9MICO|nr:zinc metallochaperone AztD [Myceligenerans sp. TRM 65318]MBE1877734.1 PQQ-like beta-propeller repeat protein [Myceligenerans sp. TRM 65318]MBE3020005.1 PQQ-like beta-propeller repeat protein [Myceligenerans sp. TRM 65318]